MTTPRNQTRSESQKSATSVPDAIELLKADHRAVEKLFAQYESEKSASKKSTLVEKICFELKIHAELEEKAFYPPVQEALGEADGDLVDEARVEHNSLKWLIGQLQREKNDAPLHEAKVKVLKEYVQHHVREEEKEMFPKVKKSAIDIVELGDTLREAKEKLIRKAAAN